ncbi:MAG: nucleoside-diphosphate kinase [Thermoguttaceae bacterium]|nr:nucleoside-diphosphate kinase [Thermoguttaceae bacterium]
MNDSIERSLVLLKPDALERRLAGRLIARFEERGFRIETMKLLHMTPDMARQHYKDLADRDFYHEIEAYITRGPVIALILSGRRAIAAVREMVGPTDGAKAPAGTIRGDLTLSFRENLVHASDSVESANREIGIFFPDFK